MLETLLGLWFLPPALFLGYLMFLALFGLRVREPAAVTGEALPWRFNVLIPAHNEEASINALIDSLQKLDYPSDQLRLMFVADHCDDSTVEIIRGRGIEVMDRQSGERGKQAALADGVHVLLPEMGRWDTLAIFDADNIVDPQFLREAAKMLDAGHPVVQGNTGIHNRDASVFTKLNHVNFSVTNRLKELARSQAGLTCRLRGHGMVFHADVVRSLNWEASSLVEDAETLLELVLSDQRAVWAHNAHVDSVIPDTAQSATAQRKRWAGGKSELTKHAIRHLAGKAFGSRDIVAFDLMVDYMMMSYAMQLGMIMLGLGASAVLLGIGHGLTFAFGLLASGFLGYFAIGCHLERVPLSTFFTFFLSPVFILWRMWVHISSLGGAKSWS